MSMLKEMDVAKKKVCSNCMERSRCKDGTECKEVLELREKMEKRKKNLKGWLKKDKKEDRANSTTCTTPSTRPITK